MSHYSSLFLSQPDSSDTVVPVSLVAQAGLNDFLLGLSDADRQWAKVCDFSAKPGESMLLRDNQGCIARVVCAFDLDNMSALAAAASALPEGVYQFDDSSLLPDEQWHALYYFIASALYRYRFSLDKQVLLPKSQRWVVHSGVDLNRLRHEIDAIAFARTLINTPAANMQPNDLAEAAKELAAAHAAEYHCTIGEEELNKAGYHGTRTVGRVGGQAPRMIDIRWGNPKDKTLTLLGKGVCFDTGGLSLKPSRGMETMKKDMGGAAHALALASLIMSQRLPVYLRVLIPAVENGIGQGAYRLGDVITYSNGATVEVMNTDAEGRLILADALIEATKDGNPDLLLDFTTLTGAARVATGWDIAPYWSNQEDLLMPVWDAAKQVQDPLWPQPLFKPYQEAFKSEVADFTNSATDGYGGAIKAALFLEHFVPEDCPWIHFDVAGWTTSSYAGMQKGGAILGVRAMYRFLEEFVSQ